MPNDAKVGLILGVVVVVVVATFFFRNQAGFDSAARQASVPVVAQPSPVAAPSPKIPVAEQTANRQHTVREGETLFTLAERYYGNRDRYTEIYNVNRGVVHNPEELTPGTVLTIPDLAAANTPPSGSATP